MQIILLTHEREATRPTNTGQLAINVYPEHCKRIVWARTAPDEALLKLLKTSDCALLFPDEAVVEKADLAEASCTEKHESRISKSRPNTLVILDATWQEARKMIRRSPYLKEAKKYALTTSQNSQFNLRRNQVDGGLCTVECIIALFKQANMRHEAEVLAIEFEQMLSQAKG
ncbi:DTW domain-containing protein [Shewanella sp. c952]|uniref:tRNA-uridine aminocarboxypropyltransferase n=1 Tax=Shewanella sp. c952 TaxID=2815913 RepID=UPI001BC53734|nr:tRNA-uridine aminocarboxypropyltransferase [Shewanella sp. c952]GIU12561.1 DTW domain-containing protein [Shewanella sp. c952]